jgi:hypothetical protein
MTEADKEEMLALMTAVNHEGETSSAWQTLKAKLKLLLTAPHVLGAAFDEGIRENVAAERRLFQEINDRAEELAADRRSRQAAAQTQHAT